MKTLTKAILISTSLIAATGTAIAFGGPGNGWGHHANNPGMMGGNHMMGGGHKQSGKSNQMGIGQLENLTSEQQEQIRQLRREQREAMMAQKDAMQDNQRELKKAIKDGADKETIQKLADVKGAQVTAMTLLRVDMQQKIRGVLTESQIAQLEETGGGSFGNHKRGGHGHR